jgi:hypothetical protein
MSYQVIAPCVLAKDQNGLIQHKYEGQLIPWLSDEQAKHFLDGEEPLVVKVGGPAVDDEPDDGKPKKTAPKADWVEYAVADGYDRDEVEAMNKADIQALFD